MQQKQCQEIIVQDHLAPVFALAVVLATVKESARVVVKEIVLQVVLSNVDKDVDRCVRVVASRFVHQIALPNVKINV